MTPSRESDVKVEDIHLGDFQRMLLARLLREVKDQAGLAALALAIETSDHVSTLQPSRSSYGPAKAVANGAVSSRIDHELTAAIGVAHEALGDAWLLVESARRRDLYGIKMRASTLAHHSARLSQTAARVGALRDLLYDEQEPPEVRSSSGPAEIDAVFCEHANEVPSRCPCPPNCYCRTQGSCVHR